MVEWVGKVNYKLKMPNRRMKTVVFHVNMLQKWMIETGFLGMEAPKEKECIPFWNDAEDGAAKIGNHRLSTYTLF